MNDTIERLNVAAYKVPTDLPESDGTLGWDSTTLVLVDLSAGTVCGRGYTYSHECCKSLIQEKLFPLVRGQDPMAVSALWEMMNAAVRNYGRRGIAATAIAAIDIALWDLKARLLNLPLARLAGMVREKIPVYGSGGFTSYSEQQLCHQLGSWKDEGITMVKMKIGRDPDADDERVQWARDAIGDKTDLFVDANGAYSQKQALQKAQRFSELDVTWFEEPVGSDDLNGLRFIRERSPAGMDVSAGEYNYDLIQARRMLEAGAVDVLQADATRCGVTGFFQAAELCRAFDVALSSHTAPSIHGHLCCAAAGARHVEYFDDHVRIEQTFFEGATTRHQAGFLQPDLSQPGLGLEFKERDAAKFEIIS